MEARQFEFDEAAKSLNECVQESCDLLRFLDDSCLSHILNLLHFKDIKALRKCCHRLRRIADAKINYRFHIIPVSVDEFGWGTVYKHADVIRHLRLHNTAFTDKVINNLLKLLQRCSNLETLELRQIDNSKLFSLIDLGNVFLKLKELVLIFEYRSCIWPSETIKSIMANCQQLEIFRIGGNIPHVFFELHFPTLLEMHISSKYFTISDESMSEFYAKNSHISKLTLMVLTDVPKVKGDFSGLTVMKNLKELRIRTDARQIIHPNFDEMPGLKIVSLMYHHHNALPSISNLKFADLDKLHIACNIRKATFHHLHEFPNQITFFEILNDPYERLSLLDITNFVRPRPNLQQLEIPNSLNFREYSNANFVVLSQDMVHLLVNKRVSFSMGNWNYTNYDKFELEKPNLCITFFEEVSDIVNITIEEVSNPSLELLINAGCNPQFLSNIRELYYSPDEYSDGSENEFDECKERLIFLRLGVTWYPIRL